MDAVKEYWKNKLFLIGIFFCIVGTILGAFGVVAPAVWIEAVGIVLMMIVIYQIDGKSELSSH